MSESSVNRRTFLGGLAALLSWPSESQRPRFTTFRSADAELSERIYSIDPEETPFMHAKVVPGDVSYEWTDEFLAFKEWYDQPKDAGKGGER